MKEPARPGKWTQRFSGIPTGIVADAMNRMNCMDGPMKPVREPAAMVGPAVTVRAMAGGNRGSHFAIYRARPGDVLVVDARGHLNTSVWGFLQTKAAMARGLAGVVINGAIRDKAEIRESGFPVFCLGATPAGPHKGWEDEINVPIACAGASVHPGDLVVGDDDGVVVIPQSRLEEVYEAATRRVDMERGWFEELEKGRPTYEIIGLEPRL